MADLEQLLDKYRQNARIHYEVGFRDKASVRKGNRAASQMIRIAQQVEEEFSGGVDAFAGLLVERDYKIDCWAAFHLIEQMNISQQLQQKALAVIERYARSDDIDAAGIQLWLKGWNKKQR
jgi:hypothetical protein